jgi:hypothetical protein
MFLLFAVLVPFGAAVAADFTVVNECSYTVFPGIFPATYQNGGWQMAPGTSVGFTLNSGWIGRICCWPAAKIPLASASR